MKNPPSSLVNNVLFSNEVKITAEILRRFSPQDDTLLLLDKTRKYQPRPPQGGQKNKDSIRQGGWNL